MNIHTPDQDLLMLAHGGLPRVTRLVAQVHVVFCPQCRRRLEKMEGASRLLADTIRGRELNRWRLPSPRGAMASARIATAWLVAVVVLTILALAIVFQVQRSGTGAAQTDRPALPSGGCRPDLPSDKCR